MTRNFTFCYYLNLFPKVKNSWDRMKEAPKSKLPDNIVTKSAYSAMRLKDTFNIKTITVKEHQHDTIH